MGHAAREEARGRPAARSVEAAPGWGSEGGQRSWTTRCRRPTDATLPRQVAVVDSPSLSKAILVVSGSGASCPGAGGGNGTGRRTQIGQRGGARHRFVKMTPEDLPLKAVPVLGVRVT